MTLTAVPAGFQVVRRFGQASLLQDRSGRWLLTGGRPTERCHAREWISLFCHEALVQTTDTPGTAELPSKDDALRRSRP